jgi:intracellular septation protein
MKFLLEFAPILAFFVAYKLAGLPTATAILIILTLLSAALTYQREKRIPMMMLVTAAIVALFGGLTLWLEDETFIKMKPTIINLLFGAVLLGGVLMKKGFIGKILGESIPMTERGWLLLSRNYGVFFLCMAALNEYVWRNFSTDFWVNFKLFGLIGLTLLFAASQIPMMQKYQTEEPTI